MVDLNIIIAGVFLLFCAAGVYYQHKHMKMFAKLLEDEDEEEEHVCVLDFGEYELTIHETDKPIEVHGLKQLKGEEWR